MMNNIEEEKLNKINEWMKNISSISSKVESLSDENDVLTTWDSQYTTIVEYNDGTEKKSYSEPNRPSIMLHEIDDHLKSWGLDIIRVKKHNFTNDIEYKGISYIRIELNPFHTDMIKFDNHNWFTYSKEKFQELVYQRFYEEAKRGNNKPLIREIKIRKVLL